MTEAEVLELLRLRHVKPGNGGSGEFAFMAHVRNGAGFDANRTFDAIVMALWPSRGLTLHAYEVKCSRNDWLRELKQPAKAEAAARHCDFFSAVVADDSIVKEGELPPLWGLLVVRGSKLVCVKEAPPLHDLTAIRSKPISRDFVVAMLRAGGAVPIAKAKEIEEAERAGYRKGLDSNAQMDAAHEDTIAKLRQTIRDFEQAAGVSIGGWAAGKDAAMVGAALKAVLRGEERVAAARSHMKDARDRLLQAADAIGKVLDQ